MEKNNRFSLFHHQVLQFLSMKWHENYRQLIVHQDCDLVKFNITKHASKTELSKFLSHQSLSKSIILIFWLTTTLKKDLFKLQKQTQRDSNNKFLLFRGNLNHFKQKFSPATSLINQINYPLYIRVSPTWPHLEVTSQGFSPKLVIYVYRHA